MENYQTLKHTNIPMNMDKENKNIPKPKKPQNKVIPTDRAAKQKKTAGVKKAASSSNKATIPTAAKKHPKSAPPGKKPVRPSSSGNRTAPPMKVKPVQKQRIYLYDRFYEKLPFFKRLNSRWHLALDLDPDKIRYVVVRKAGEDIQVIKWGIQKFPSEERDRRKALQIALENVKSKVYKRGMDVTASIFSPEISIRQVIFPKMNKTADLKQAIYNKNIDDLKNFDEKSVWNYEILDELSSEGIEKYRLMIVAVPEEVISYYVNIFNNAKLELKTLIPRPAALQGTYRRMVFRPDRDLLIDIAYDLTQMCYLKNGELEMIRNVSIGSRNLEVTIRDQALKMDSKGEGEKESNDRVEKPSQLRSRLLDKIKDLKSKQNPVLHTFFSEILRSLAYIQGRNVQQYIERIFITGYGIRKESLLPYLKGRLSMPMFVLTPQFVDLDKRTIEYSGFFSTIGTVLQERPVFNLLPASYKSRFVLRKLNYLLITIIIVLFFGLGYLSVRQKAIILDKQSLAEKYRTEYSNLNPIEKKYKEVLQQIAVINKKNQELKGYVKSKPYIIQVLRLFSNETPRNIHLNKIQFIKLTANTQNTKGSSFHNDYTYQIDIEGFIQIDPLMGDVTLINYINHLKDLKYFKHMELLNKLKDPELSITKFGLRLYL